MIMMVKPAGKTDYTFDTIYLCTNLEPDRAMSLFNEIYIEDIIHEEGEPVTDYTTPFGFRNMFFN